MELFILFFCIKNPSLRFMRDGELFCGTGIGTVFETKPFSVGASGAGASGSTTVTLDNTYTNVYYALRLSNPRYDTVVYINGVSENRVTVTCTAFYSGYRSVSGDVVVYSIE